MSQTENKSAVMQAVERAARGYIQAVRARPWMWLAIYLVISVASAAAASALMKISTDLESLLPQGTPSVAALEESRERKGSTDSYTIAVTSPSPEANVKMVLALAEEIKKWPEARFVQVDRDASFFAERALLYLPQEDLQKLRDQIDEEVTIEKKRLNPFFVDLRTSEEIAAENQERWRMERWLDPNLSRRLGLEQDLFGSIVSPEKLGLNSEGEAPAAAKPDDKAGGSESKGQGADEAAKEPEPKVPAELKKYLLNDDGTVAVLLAELTQPATDVVKSRELMERGEALIDKLNPKGFHPEMDARVAGAYRNFEEVKSISNDSTVATIASLVLVLLVLLVFFRNVRSVVLLIVPLGMGVVWSVGMTAVTYGRLNISTLFVFSMLIGMGIDFGIHYYARILEEYQNGRDMDESVLQSTLHTGRAMVSAALTTIAALLTLTSAHFRGFIEFGIIASYGIALCLAAALLVMPVVIFVLERMSKTGRKAADEQSAFKPLDAGQLRTARMVGVGFIIVGVLGAAFAVVNWEKAQFEHDFRNLRGPKTKTGIKYGGAVGRGKSTSPAMILARSVDDMRQVHEFLAQEMLNAKDEDGDGETDTYLKSFVTIQTYVPPEQAKRMAIIKEINEIVSDKKLKRAKGKAGRFIKRMRDLSAIEPFELKDIPEWARRSITEKDGTVGHIGYLYSSVRKWDAMDVRQFQDAFGLIPTASGEVPVASSSFIVADVVKTVKEDALRLMPIVFVVLLVILLIDLRSVRGTIICLISMGVALLWTVSGMILFDIRLGLYNMIVLPMVLGTGIDGSIHLYHRFTELGTTRIHEVLRTTGGSVVASSMTTMAGFSGLLFVQHLGVKSIGDLAVVGIISTLIAVFSFMPGLLMLFFGPKTQAQSPQPSTED